MPNPTLPSVKARRRRKAKATKRERTLAEGENKARDIAKVVETFLALADGKRKLGGTKDA